MPEYSTIPIGLRIFLMILIIILLLIVGFIILNNMGVIEGSDLLAPFYNLFGIQPKTTIDVDDPLLLAKQRLAKDFDAISLREEELYRWQEELASTELEINQKTEELTESGKSLEEKEKSIKELEKEYDDSRERLVQMANQFTGMPPEEAVNIMLEMDDLEVVDLLSTVEELAAQAGEISIVPYWFTLMPPERAARIRQLWQ